MIYRIFVMFALATMSTYGALHPGTELNKTTCWHHLDANQDPTLTVTFTYKDNDFAEVTIEERFTSKYTHDSKWVELHKQDEQVVSNETNFAIGINDLNLSINRPIPSSNTENSPNATLDFGNGTIVKLHCEKSN